MAASEGPEKLRDLVDARAFRPDLSFCMGSIEATIFMDLSAESASGAVDKVKFLAKLDKHASKLGGGTSKSKATAARKKNAAMGGMVDDLAMLSLGGARSRSDGSSSGGDPRLRRLLQRMNRELPDALRDLERTGCKKGHWAWWWNSSLLVVVVFVILGAVVGSYMGIGLLWILGGVEKPEFNNIGWLVLTPLAFRPNETPSH